jgi:hypothetical protein
MAEPVNNPTASALAEAEATVKAEQAKATEQAKTNDPTPNKETKEQASDKTPAGQGSLDYKSEYEKVKKSYEDLRGEFTRRTQSSSAVEKKLAEFEATQKNLLDLITKASEQPHDPEKFMSDLKTQGPKFFEQYVAKHIDSMKKEFGDSLTAQATRANALESQLVLFQRRADSKNYPDFVTLEPEMQKLAEDPATPVDFTKPISEVYDALYNLAKSKHSADALKVAQDDARKKAEADLVAESKATVTGGGKTTPTPTPD